MKLQKIKIKTKLEFRANIIDETDISINFTPNPKKKKLADIIIVKKKNNEHRSNTKLF